MKKIWLVFLSFFLILILTGCNRSENKDSNQLNIVTSFYPMYIATSNIIDGIDKVSLTNMTNTEVGCLHDYQLTTKDMNILERADVFVINGGGMESFLDKAIQAYPKLEVVNASEGILEAHENEKHADEKKNTYEHDHGENAHIWVSISMYIEQIKNIANSLSKIDTIHKEKYLANANRYIAKLETLKLEMHKDLDALSRKKIVTFHEAFDFFAEEFHLDVVAVIEREPGTNPSAGELAKIIDKVRKTNAIAIFVEPQYEMGTANVIAQETNIPVYMLDPVVTGDLEKNAYEKTMRKNLEVLKEALK